jgi:hypothetical protein
MSPVAFKNTGLPLVVMVKEHIIVGVVVETVVAVESDLAQLALMFALVAKTVVKLSALGLSQVLPFQTQERPPCENT